MSAGETRAWWKMYLWYGVVYFLAPAAIVIMCTWMWFLYQTNTSVKAFVNERLCIGRTKQTRLAPIQQLLLLLSLQRWKECVWIQNFRGVNPVCRKTKGSKVQTFLWHNVWWLITSEWYAGDNAAGQGVPASRWVLIEPLHNQRREPCKQC